MRKNKMMRLAGAMLVATMLSTCAISGTFAKYTTKEEAKDSAKIADWGVVLQLKGNLYGDAYDNNNKVVIYNGSDNTQAVRAITIGDKIVAPGTQSTDDGLAVLITGRPEVGIKLYGTVKTKNIYLKTGSYALPVDAGTVNKADFVADKYYTKSDNDYTKATEWSTNTTYYTMQDACTITSDYYPVIYKGFGKTNGTNAADSESAIGKEIYKLLKGSYPTSDPTADTTTGITEFTVSESDAKSYPAGTDLSSITNLASTKLTWEWVFDSGSDKINSADTILGHLIAGKTVVALNNSTYNSLTVDTTNNLVKQGTDTVASISTKFEIDLRVTQQDTISAS